MPLYPVQPNGDVCFPLPDGTCVGPKTSNPPKPKEAPNPFKPDKGNFDEKGKGKGLPKLDLPPEPLPVTPPPPEPMPVYPGEGPQPLPVVPPPPEPL